MSKIITQKNMKQHNKSMFFFNRDFSRSSRMQSETFSQGRQPRFWRIFAFFFFYSLCSFLPQEASAQNKPDLFIGSIAVNPTVGPPGGHVQLTFEVRNGGTADAGPFNASLYFSVVATLDTTKATLLKSIVINGLKAGRAATYKVNVFIPKQAAVNKTAYLGIMADSGRTVTESNETNNATTTTFNVKPGPDITVSSLSLSSGTAIRGTYITVNFTVRNIGRADSKPFYIYIYFSSDSLIGGKDTSLASIYIQYLRASTSLTISRRVYIPSNAIINKTYYIGVSADPDQRVSEEDETNNIRKTQIKIVPASPTKYPDMTVTSFKLIDKTQSLGGRVYYQATFKNQGQANAYFYVYMDYGTATDFRTQKSWRIVYRHLLAPGKSYIYNSHFQVPWRSPYNIAPKDYYVRLRITSVSPKELLTTNNTSQTLTLHVIKGKSQLTYSSVTFYPSVCNYLLDASNNLKSPRILSGTIRITNSGYADSGSFKVGIYLSDDTLLATSDILITKITMPSISPQASITKNYRITTTAKIPPGSYRIGVIVDPDNEAKNDTKRGTRYTWLFRSSQLPFTKTLPDLFVDKIVLSPAQKAGVGTRVSFEIWVRNRSSQAINGGCYHRTYSRFHFADDAKLTQVRFSSYNLTFPTNKVTRITGYINIPGTLAPRKGYMFFQMDTSKVHQVLNKANNIKVVPYELLGRKVDLKIISATSDPTLIPWEKSVKVSIALANQGTLKQVSNVRTCVWFSYDKKLEPQDLLLGSINIYFPRVPSLTGTMTFIAKRWNPGKAYLILQADCDKKYSESDEKNNFVYIPITIRKFDVDFTPISLKIAPNFIRPNLKTTIKVEFQNKGKDKHIKRVAACVYFSNDAVFDSKDPAIYCGYTTDIYNHIGSVTFNLTGNARYLAGTRYIFAQVDSGYYYVYQSNRYAAPTYDESNEKNNMIKAPIYVRNDVDVTTGSISISKTIAKVGDNLTFRFQIKNIGTVGTNTPFNVLVVFSENEVIDKSDILIRKIRMPALAPGKTSPDFSISYALSKKMQPGERYFGLVIDSDHEIVEVDETNNIGFVKVNVLIPGIDLQARKIRLDRSIIPAGKASKVKIYSEIQNFGTTSSPAFTIGYYLSTDKFFDPGDTLLKTRSYSKTLPSTARTGQFVDEVTITLKQANTFYILIVADPANKIRELNKKNNFLAAPIQIVNSSPRITSRPGIRAIEKQLYSYNARAFDPDGDPLTWRLAKAPGGMTLDKKTGKVAWTPQSFHGGQTFEVTLEVSDGRGGVGKQTFKLNVQSTNDPPKIISTAPARALANKAFTYTPKASDPDPNEVLTWVLINAPTGMQIDTKTGKITWLVPSALNGRKVSVSVQVSDQAGASDRQNFSLQITKQNSPPKIISAPPSIVYEGTTFRYQAVASDADVGDTLTWSRISGPTSLKIDSSSGLLSWSVPTGLQGQKVKVSIRVSDQVGSYADQSFELKAKRNNNPPTIISRPPSVAFVGKVFAYKPKASDPDPGEKLSWSILTAPPGITFNKASGKITWTPSTGYKGKTVKFSLQVLDTGSAKDIQNFQLLVGQYCEVDSDCASGQLCLLKICRPPGCFTSKCNDPKKPICGEDGSCRANLCLGISCTGGEFCREGKCVPVCAYVNCNPNEMCVDGKCLVDKCSKVTCQQGQRCEAGTCIRDACTKGKCLYKRVCAKGTCSFAPCSNITCPDKRMICQISPIDRKTQCVLPLPCQVDQACSGNQICVAGTCIPPSCYDTKNACGSGLICLRGKCQKDPCAGISCSKSQFCREGRCIDVCAGISCVAGRVCEDGRCVADSCSAANCKKDEVCVNGLCKKNACTSKQACKFGRVCSNNLCIQDPCRHTKCPILTQQCKMGQCLAPPKCQLDSECSSSQLCVNGRCAPTLCGTSSFCSNGSLCINGRCKVNPCHSKKCAQGTYCRNGLCVGSCAGVFCSKGESCVFGLCQADPCATASCVKGEVCVNGQCRQNICTSSSKPCKQGRVCTTDGCVDSPCRQAACSKGQLCSPASGLCTGTINCKSDSDCNSTGVCLAGKCVKAGCYQAGCAQREVCTQGSCQKNLCNGKSCPKLQYCNITGKCSKPCNCPKGTRCGPKGCETDPCSKISCKVGKVCIGGQCFDKCDPSACKFGRICIPGQGCATDPCTRVTCPSNTICRRGYCSDPCSELTCPTGTICRFGQCLAPQPKEVTPTEKNPEPTKETVPEPAKETTPEPANEPAKEAAPEPTKESAPEPQTPDEPVAKSEGSQGTVDGGVDKDPSEKSLDKAQGAKPDQKGNAEELLPDQGCNCQSTQSPISIGWLLMLFALVSAVLRRKRRH